MAENLFDGMDGARFAAKIILQSEQPLDARSEVDTYDDLQKLIDEHGAYKGMDVYVKDEDCTYHLNGENEWIKILDSNGVISLKEIPIASLSQLGVIKLYSELINDALVNKSGLVINPDGSIYIAAQNGVHIDDSGCISVDPATQKEVNEGTEAYKPVTPKTLKQIINSLGNTGVYPDEGANKKHVDIMYRNEDKSDINMVYFIIDEDAPEETNAVLYNNVIFSSEEPKTATAENWFQLEGGGEEGVTDTTKIVMQDGLLKVLKEPEDDTTFLNN